MYKLYYTLTDKRGYLSFVDGAVFIGFKHQGHKYFLPLFAFSRTISAESIFIDGRTLLSWSLSDYEVPSQINEVLESYKHSIPFTDEMIHDLENYMTLPGATPVLPEEYIPISDLGIAFDTMLSLHLRSAKERAAHPSFLQEKRKLFINSLTPYMSTLSFSPSNLPSTSL